MPERRQQRRRTPPRTSTAAAPHPPRHANEERAPSRERIALTLAAEIVAEAVTRNVPADDVLRQRLRAARPGREIGAEVARLVFAWFRWCGWFRGPAAEHPPLARALALAEQFAADPGSITDKALFDHAVPRWVSRVMPVSPAFLRALQRSPRLWLRVRPGRMADLGGQLPGVRPAGRDVLPDAAAYEGVDDLFRTAAFAAGLFEIQDVASQAVGAVCAPKPGETWWDACAGEGGKTLHLSDLMQNRGVIWASDRSARRLAVLRRRAARAGAFNLRPVAWDGGERPPTRTLFDGVLLDAPCSGIGTWQRNPHARWTTRPEDVSELATVQSRLLRTVAGSVKPGGRLVYAVCTLTEAETAGVASAFSAERGDFEPLPFPDPLAPSRPPVASVTWWPQDYGSNGMFVAAWRRVSR